MSGLGHIGELQIIDDLQKNHKFEIYLPLKDKGLDFIGLKNNSSIQVQVKTSKFQKTHIIGLIYIKIKWFTVKTHFIFLFCMFFQEEK